VLFFQGEGEQYGDFYVYGEELKKLSEENAVFVRIPFTANRDKAPDTGSPVPASKLLGDNPARDYGVPVGRAMFIVTDWHGNDMGKIDRKPSVNDLKALIDAVPGKVESLSKKLQKNYDAAKTAWDKQDRGAALSKIGSNFKEGIVGLEPQVSTISLYNEIMDSLRAKLAEMIEKGDIDGIKGLAKDRNLRGTALAKEAEEALKKARPTTQEKADKVEKKEEVSK
jgi:hypothetical protein